MFKDTKLKTKLIIQAVLLTGLIIAIGLLGIKGIQAATHGAEEIYEGGMNSIEYLNDLKTAFAVDINATAEKIRDETLSWGEGAYIIAQAIGNLSKYEEGYAETSLATPKRSAHLKLVLAKASALADKLLELIKNEEKDKFISYIKTNLYPITIPAIEEINALILSHVNETKNDYEKAKETSQFFENLMLLMTAIAILFAVLFSIFIIKSITGPLAKTIEVIDKVSMGDHSIQVEVGSKNEIGSILLALKRMVESIKSMTVPLLKVSQGDLTGNVEVRSEHDILAHAINNMIVQLKEMISETQEEIIAIANSAEEVTASIAEVSAGTTETAAAVTETMTTVEELQQTAQASSTKAEDVLKNSEETIRIVKASEHSLKHTIEDMTQIQEKMNVISESIVKLSEHSLTIGDIITSVNELAEQSNLLAVNAAIEAAKAGEQGKGFSVVAQEIRTLAEQSKTATSQVRAILNDIQNATSTAVMATEQGSKAVGKGVKQSLETNTAMQSLVANIAQVSQTAKQISISSQQQLIGVAQVRTAMSNINLASEQHVEHMKQIETAILSLNEVSKTLKRLISQYKIS